MNRSPHRISFAFATVYFVISSLWIYFSDRLVLHLSADAVVQAVLQSYKGMAFVTVSSLLLYGIMRSVLVREWSARQALHESEMKFRDLVETTSDWIWEVDREGAYSYVSPAIENLLGYRPEEVIGKTPFDLMPPEERERVREIFQSFASRHLPFADLPNINLHRDGRHIVLETSGVPVFDAEGRWRGYRGIDRDITERKRNEEALLQALTHEREIDRLKNEFIATAAHELRTPLTCVLGYAELLQQAETETAAFSPVQRLEFISHILDKGELLNKIVDDLLDVGRLKSGHIPLLAKSSCDLALLLEEALASYRRTAVRHRFEISRPVPAVQVDIDRVRMLQALDNLISNAVKYSPKGGTIYLQANRHDGEVEISIRDEGIGMDVHQLSRMFDPFYRADVSNTALGGLGLGTAIAKGIIEAHGGRIEVQSAPGRGSTVSITLPLED